MEGAAAIIMVIMHRMIAIVMMMIVMMMIVMMMIVTMIIVMMLVMIAIKGQSCHKTTCA
jgi:hypothetical protein